MNAEDYDGWTALHVACYYGAAKLQVTARTAKGQTPLHTAVEMAESSWVNRQYDYGLVIQLLLAARADVNAVDSMGHTPLQVRVLCVCGLRCWGEEGGACCKLMCRASLKHPPPLPITPTGGHQEPGHCHAAAAAQGGGSSGCSR